MPILMCPTPVFRPYERPPSRQRLDCPGLSLPESLITPPCDLRPCGAAYNEDVRNGYVCLELDDKIAGRLAKNPRVLLLW